ncbi:MAG: hypothetical protein C0595_07305 [Marinilabiliales bacterium]|nr:MAG: hypothetical protein C0595_07305 [Marinilabiliales bacterium]
MKKLIILSLVALIYSTNLFSQGDYCVDSEPFCTNNLYQFPAGVNSGTAETGPYYGCLSTRPNPAWYHMKIAIAGSINIYMYSTPLRDIDFICWGPFADPVTPCTAQLTANKVVACSYSPNPTENCFIPNGQVGEYYILLITNYSNQPCDITFEKTAGTGETDCTIVPPPIGNNGPLCVGDNLQLWADDFTGATYYWTGPNGWTSTLQNPTILNVGLENKGDYTLVITVNGSDSDPVTTFVSISPKPTPDFDFNNACLGDTTFFIDQTTVDPPSSTVTTWKWEFGNGETAFGEDMWYLYSAADAYNVTLTTYTALMGCPQSVTHTVNVYDAANVEAGEDQTIPNGWTTQLDGTVDGGSGNYDILWTPESLLQDPTVVDAETNPLGATQVFKLTVTDEVSQCINTDSTTVIVTGGPLSVTATASPMVICEGEIVHLSANPNGGSGNNEYSWSSNPSGFTADIKEPSDFPTETTTYYVQVFDGQTTVEGEITVQVKPKPVGNAGEDKTITVGTSTQLNGSSVSGGSGNYNFSWTPAAMLEDATVLKPYTQVLNDNMEYSLIVNDENGCSSEVDKIWVFTGGDGLSINPTASPDVICLNEQTTLNPNAYGGGGNYSFEWSDENGFYSENENPIVSPSETTVYTCIVDDGFKTVSNEVTVTVNPLPIIDLLPDGYQYYSQDTIKACVRDSVNLDAGHIGNPANMNYLWSNSATSRKLNVTTNGSWIDFQTYSVEVENPITLCAETSEITIFFDFNECEIGVEEISSLSENISIIPNPTSGVINLNIKNLNGEIDITISDVTGKTIFNKENLQLDNSDLTQHIDLSKNPAGVYIIKIKHLTGDYFARIIKQ